MLSAMQIYRHAVSDANIETCRWQSYYGNCFLGVCGDSDIGIGMTDTKRHQGKRDSFLHATNLVSVPSNPIRRSDHCNTATTKHSLKSTLLRLEMI